MSSKKEIDCIKRMIEKGLLEELKEFILEYELASQGDFPEHSREYETASFILSCLKQDTKTIQLVDFEWTLLPVEYIKLTVVTTNEKKEFTHGL